MRVKKARRRPGKQEFIADVPRNAAPKGAKLKAEFRNAQKEFGGKKCPPQSVLDAIAERSLTGGFKVDRKPCGSCFQFRSANGSCGCRSRTSDRKVRGMTVKKERIA
jgi:hypothetical protein